MTSTYILKAYNSCVYIDAHCVPSVVDERDFCLVLWLFTACMYYVYMCVCVLCYLRYFVEPVFCVACRYSHWLRNCYPQSFETPLLFALSTQYKITRLNALFRVSANERIFKPLLPKKRGIQPYATTPLRSTFRSKGGLKWIRQVYSGFSNS